MSDIIETVGTIWGVFAHRFALDTKDGKVLADIGPASLDTITLREGDEVRVRGDRKRSEIKVAELVGPDGAAHKVAWPPKHDHAPADPQIALRAVEAAGYAVGGEPRRKPKHWEVPASRGGRFYDLHVELDGQIRKSKKLAV